MELNVNVIKITADVFDWTIETVAQSLQTFLDGNYYVVAYFISISYAVLKSIAETVSFSAFVLRCYYLDFLAFLAELSTGISFVISAIYGFFSRLALSVITGLGCISSAISSVYFKILFVFHFLGYYITLCAEEIYYFINVCFAAILLLLQLGPNFLIFLWNILILSVSKVIGYLHFIALSFSNFCAYLCNRCFIFVLTIPLKAYFGLIILLFIIYARKTIVRHVRLALISLVVVTAKLLLCLWAVTKIIFNTTFALCNKVFNRGSGQTRVNRTLHQFCRNALNFKIFESILTFPLFRKKQNHILDSAEKEKFLCVVCQDKEKNVLLIPCRHLCLCEECAATIHQSYMGCPLCRIQILDTYKNLGKEEMISKIISGGQTGVDQAALFVGTKFGIPVGGWCSLGGLDENNVSILEKYPLKEVTGFSFEESINERTKRNIEDGDGTLIIVPTIPLPEHITDGTLLTINYAKERQKPFILISVCKSNAVDEIWNWIREHKIKVLNIAGPRESNSPGIYNQSCNLLQQFLLADEAFAQLKNNVGD